jgi:hypothetical protein
LTLNTLVDPEPAGSVQIMTVCEYEVEGHATPPMVTVPVESKLSPEIVSGRAPDVGPGLAPDTLEICGAE